MSMYRRYLRSILRNEGICGRFCEKKVFSKEGFAKRRFCEKKVFCNRFSKEKTHGRILGRSVLRKEGSILQKEVKKL